MFLKYSKCLFNMIKPLNNISQQSIKYNNIYKIVYRKFCDANGKYLNNDYVTTTSIFNIKKSIKSSGINLEDGFSSIQTYCPICRSSLNTDQIELENNRIYINKITGNVICPGCQHVGKWNTFETFFQPNNKISKTIKELEKLKEVFLNSKKRNKFYIPDKLVPCKQLKTDEFQIILRNLNLLHFPENIFYNLNTFCDVKNVNSLHFPLYNINDEIVGYKILKYDEQNNCYEEETIPDKNSFGLIVYKIKQISSTSPLSASTSTTSTTTTANFIRSSQKIGGINNAIIVLNLLDLLSLSIQKINSTIICLPHSFKSLPQECLPGLESYQKLILWFNYDTAGWDTAKMFSKKLDERRCLFVRPTEEHPTPYKALLQNIDLKMILTKAQPILHKSITTFHSLRQDVLSDLQNIDKVQGVKWRRYPTLNKLLKGHRKGELTILTGPTGCGKTTFMSEYSLDLSLQGVTTLWGSFEIRNTRLASTLLRQLAGCQLDENLNIFNYWADEFERLPIYFMTFHGQQTIKVVMEAIEHAQYVHDIQHVIIDNVQFMMGTSDESKHMDRFWKQDAIIASFRTFATKKNCHVTLVIHPRKERDSEDLTTSSIFGSAKATQEADNVLIIQDKRLTSLRGKKYLQVAKNRYSGDLGIMPLDFDKNSLSYAQKKKKDDKVNISSDSAQENPE